MEYFLGLTFDPGSIHHAKVASFRSRFDSKFTKNETLQLTILPPFAVEFKTQTIERNFIEELTELMEGHLFGLDEVSQIEFNGMNFSMGKKGFLSLTPIISPDIIHCQESIYSFLKEYGVKFKNSSTIYNPQLPIGRFEHGTPMEPAIDTAKVEFADSFVMHARSLVLFEKTPKEWIEKFNLFDFENRNQLLLKDQNYA